MSAPLPVILPLGALIQSFPVGADNHNIVLNFNSSEDYKTHNGPYFGETIGRVANRISGAKINSLNGRSYDLVANNGPNSLHGGREGWGKKLWKGPVEVQRPDVEGHKRTALEYRYLSPHGEENYPGAVECRVWHWMYRKAVDGKDTTTLEVEYEVEMVGDAAQEEGVEETVVAVTNHSYFNLTAGPSVAGTLCTLPSTLHQPVDSTSIPLGQIAPFPDLPTNHPFALGPNSPAIDHCMVVNDKPSSIPVDSRELPLRQLVFFSAPDTKISLRVESTEPAFQLYTGDMTNVPAVGGAPARGKRSGVAVEPSRYVNAVNVPEWRPMVTLKRGRKWGSRSRYVAWQE